MPRDVAVGGTARVNEPAVLAVCVGEGSPHEERRTISRAWSACGDSPYGIYRVNQRGDSGVTDWRRVRADDKAWRAVLLKDPCVWCGNFLTVEHVSARKYGNGTCTPMTIDHILSREDGGPRHHWGNQAAACWNCNHTRGADGILAFLLRRQQIAKRFAPGPNWERNRLWKEQRRRRRARRELAMSAVAVDPVDGVSTS